MLHGKALVLGHPEKSTFGFTRIYWGSCFSFQFWRFDNFLILFKGGKCQVVVFRDIKGWIPSYKNYS